MDRFWCALVAILLASPSAFGQAAPPADPLVVADQSRLDGDRLTFTVEKRDGDIAGANGPASVFIDVVNLPLARLTTCQGGWYAGAK